MNRRARVKAVVRLVVAGVVLAVLWCTGLSCPMALGTICAIGIAIISMIAVISCLPTTRTVDIVEIDGERIRIADVRDCASMRWRKRGMLDDKGGAISFIDLKGGRRQPYLIAFQDVIDDWYEGHGAEIKNVLVLGGAGCAMPRYFLKSYDSCRVISVELSKKMIEIATRYFIDGLDSRRFYLCQGDAGTYLKTVDMAGYDVVFSDVFAGNKVVNKVYTENFFRDVHRHMRKHPQSVFVANLGGVSPYALDSIFANISAVFPWVGMARSGNGLLLLGVLECGIWHADGIVVATAKNRSYRWILCRRK